MSALAHDFLSFINASPTPYHAVSSAKTLLLKAGFKQVSESQSWKGAVKPGGKYFVTRNGSSIIAFALGGQWQAGNAAAMIGAHTDSPCLRLKPKSKRSAEGYLQVGVETYGGGIWHSWFDRDLSLAGRVMVESGDGTFEQKLLRIHKPLLRIPTLAIHLDRTQNEAFKFNNETHLTPILGTIEAQLNAASASDATHAAPGASATAGLLPMKERHHTALLDLVASELGLTSVDQICDFELVLYDTQPSCLGGIKDELIFSPRLDNLCCTYASVRGLIASLEDESLSKDGTIRLISCFDHEEIGSLSQQGADSNFLPSVLLRIHDGSSAALAQCCSTSFLISADMAHAYNPNYGSHYESEHKPRLNQGVVVKVNANQRYTTNAPGVLLIDKLAKKAGAKLQLFVIRQDSPCGGTIGPMLSAKLGVRTLDLGNPQLSMHSIRETGGTQDLDHIVNLFATFFREYRVLSEAIYVD